MHPALQSGQPYGLHPPPQEAYHEAEEIGLDKVLLIGFAGALGAVSRYAVQNTFNSLMGGPTLYGTFIVNITGAFILGLVVGLGENGFLNDGPWRTVFTVGFLGAYTTFSTFMLETTTRSESGRTDIAVFYLASSVIIGLVSVYGGLSLGRVIH
jgi:CrcB protein